jgi:uncharacterized membrane protein
MGHPSLRRFFVFLLVVSMMVAVPYVLSESYVTPEELTFLVQYSGYAYVDYLCSVDPTRVSVNVSLFGAVFEDIFVDDQDGVGLDYSFINGGITVDTLAATSILVTYATTELTGKVGQMWTFSAETPISASIIFPEGSTVFPNVVPLAMGSVGERVLVIMPAGEVEVSYTLSFVGTREYAQTMIKDAEETIQEIKAEGIIITKAEARLAQAYQQFESQNYPEAELLAEDAKESALETQALAQIAHDEITTVNALIAERRALDPSLDLSEAETLMEQADEAYEAGNYEETLSLTGEAKTTVENATSQPSETSPVIPMTWLVVITVVVAGVGFMFYTRRRRTHEPLEAAETSFSFNLKRLFESHPHLRMDDREVIRFLASSGGEAFAAEIRERFDVPRTSLWRMIRRLEGEEVVEVSMVGGQSLVRIDARFRSGGAEG